MDPPGADSVLGLGVSDRRGDAMRGAVLISWGNIVRGREKMALDVFGKAISYADELAKEGNIASHQEYLALNGDLGRRTGFMIVEGDLDQLRALDNDRQWRKNLFAGSSVVEGMTIQTFAGGNDQSLQEQLGLGVEVETELGLI
jgi:hypothetical protein